MIDYSVKVSIVGLEDSTIYAAPGCRNFLVSSQLIEPGTTVSYLCLITDDRPLSPADIARNYWIITDGDKLWWRGVLQVLYGGSHDLFEGNSEPIIDAVKESILEGIKHLVTYLSI